jgi:ketosteroid isomerase-like protein
MRTSAYIVRNLALCAVISYLCIPAAYSQDSAEQVIRQNITRFSESLVEGDYDALVNAYTSDGKLLPPGRDVLHHSSAIRSYWTPPGDRQSRTVYHHVTPEEIVVTGSTAYDWGYYEGRTRNADGTETPWKGKYVIIWKEISPGEWKIYVDIWNRM